MKESTEEKVENKSGEKTEEKKEPTVHKEAEKPVFVLLGILLGAFIVAITFFVASVNKDAEPEAGPVKLVPAQQPEYDSQEEQAAADAEDGSAADAGTSSGGLDITSGVVTEVPDEPTADPGNTAVGVTPSNQPGRWNLMNYRNEEFDSDDDEKLEIDNVCGENRGVTTYCDNVSLSSSSAPGRGNEKCPPCTVGQTCLLWDDDEEDDGDLEVQTATYLCE